jgi:hypothetical protein
MILRSILISRRGEIAARIVSHPKFRKSNYGTGLLGEIQKEGSG